MEGCKTSEVDFVRGISSKRCRILHSHLQVSKKVVGEGDLMENPLVSIIMLNYNGGDFLIESVRSILKTSYPNFEFILIDNGSKDDSLTKG